MGNVHLQRGVAVLAIAVGALRAEAQNSADDIAGTDPDDPTELQPQPDSHAAPEPDRADTDVGSIEERIGSADDVLQQLETGARGRKASVFKSGPIAVVHPHWQALNNKLDEKISLRLGFSYYALFQYTTPGPDPRSAASGDFDFFGRLILVEGEERARGQIGFNIEHRHAYTDIAPSRLALGIGSIWRTTRGFTDSGFNFNELWWNQRFANDRVGLRIGTINQKHFYDLHSFKSQKLFFLSAPLSDSPTISFPRPGLGARLRVSPLEELHISAGIGDANGDRSVGGFDTFFGDAEFFSALDLAFTPTFEGLGQGRYSVTFWHIDARSSRGIPSGRGFSALIEQEVAPGVVPFARYGYGDGATVLVEHLVALGVGFERPFDADDDVAGVGGSWARPSVPGARDQWGLELFYRAQITPVIQLTPGFQLIINPSLDPSKDVVGVFQMRLGVVF